MNANIVEAVLIGLAASASLQPQPGLVDSAGLWPPPLIFFSTILPRGGRNDHAGA